VRHFESRTTKACQRLFSQLVCQASHSGHLRINTEGPLVAELSQTL